MELKGEHYYLDGLLCGLKQLNPKGGWLQHNPTKGWQINTPNIQECNEILLQDDLTYQGNKVVEIEKYIAHYGDDIKNITFHSWHKNIKNVYPQINFKWCPFFLKNHQQDAVKHKQELYNTFNFSNKSNKFLCLNARRRTHRDTTYLKVRDNQNCVKSYTHKGIQSPLANDWLIADYRDWNVKNKDYLTNTMNLLVASPLYNQTSFSLVTETRASLPFDFVTEKTTQCFIALHPALYVSNKDHVMMLRDWGFDVFDDIFDHSYDKVDNNTRIDTLFKDNIEVITHGLTISEDIQKRLIKNREYYFTKFYNVVNV